MLSAIPPSNRDRIQQLNAKYDLDATDGYISPFVYPWGSLGIYLVIAYLLIPHRRNAVLRRARYLVWAFNTAFAAYTIAYTRGRGAVAAYGVGFAMAWSIVWSTIILMVHDGQLDFARIERATGSTGRVRYDEARHEQPEVTKHHQDSRNKSNTEARGVMDSKLIWQGYPDHPFLERLDWVLDLMANFRGMAWNWRIPNLPNPPREVLKQLSLHGDPRNRNSHRSGRNVNDHTFLGRDALLRRSLRALLVGYIALDVIKTLIIHDPFFSSGNFDLPGPTYLPPFLSSSKIFMKSQRLLLAQLAVYWALQTIFQTASLFFVGILGSERIGVRGQNWVYPAEWGSYGTVFDRGLSGWWGNWWHQSFRFAFESPGKKIVKLLSLDPRSLSAKVLQLFIAFSISGFLHANASHTSIGATRPIRGPFSFFILQPFGIVAQMIFSQLLKRAGITRYVPKPVRQTFNFVFVHMWFFYTAPLFIEDVAAGGQFLYEPIPISFLRGMGLGTEGDSFYCWDGPWPRFHSGSHWWESGIVT